MGPESALKGPVQQNKSHSAGAGAGALAASASLGMDMGGVQGFLFGPGYLRFACERRALGWSPIFLSTLAVLSPVETS